MLLTSEEEKRREENIFRFSREGEKDDAYSKENLSAIFLDRAMPTSRTISFCRFLLIIGTQLRVPVSTRGRRYMSGVSHAATQSPHVTTVRHSHGDRISEHHVHDTRITMWPVFLVYLFDHRDMKRKKIVNFSTSNSLNSLNSLNQKY